MVISNESGADGAVKFLLQNPFLVISWGLVAFIALNVIKRISVIYRSDLRSVPGPSAARISGIWRAIQISDGNAPEFYNDLHKKYGPIVRTAPNVVSISDPKAIAPIYNAGSKYMKVCIHEFAVSRKELVTSVFLWILISGEN